MQMRGVFSGQSNMEGSCSATEASEGNAVVVEKALELG